MADKPFAHQPIQQRNIYSVEEIVLFSFRKVDSDCLRSNAHCIKAQHNFDQNEMIESNLTAIEAVKQ